MSVVVNFTYGVEITLLKYICVVVKLVVGVLVSSK